MRLKQIEKAKGVASTLVTETNKRKPDMKIIRKLSKEIKLLLAY